MATRPFKIVIKDGQHVRQDLTDEEIADCQRRTDEENAQRQERDREAARLKRREELIDQLLAERFPELRR